MSRILRNGQQVPDWFADVLREMHRNLDTRRLRVALATAVDQGWTLTALGNALGMTREGVRQHVRRVQWANAVLPEIPPPPLMPEPAPKPPTPTERHLTAEVVAELQRMQAVARTVTGGTAVDDPRRRVSERYSATLADLVERGVPKKHLAEAVGVDPNTIAFRLARHGYHRPPPSFHGRRDQTYRNRKTAGRRSAVAA